MTLLNTKRATRRAMLMAGVTAFAATVVVAYAVQAQSAAGVRSGGSLPLSAGDGIRVRVFGDSVLNGEFTVDERGMLVLPKLGEWSVASIPADSVRGRLVARLREYLVNPAIEVIPFRRIAIVGAVNKPGLYPVDAGMSVAEAIILAQGPTPEARENAVELRLPGRTDGDRVPLEQRVWDTAVGNGAQLYVPQRSWWVRNGLRTFTIILSTASTLSFIIWQTSRR